MFNGIIYNQGIVSKIIKRPKGLNIFVKSDLKLSNKDIGLSVACDGVLTPDNLCPPNEITVESLEVITLPAISIDPSVMLDSAKFIDDESSEETVVPFILKAPTTMCPVPDAEMFISSFDLVPVILLSLIVLIPYIFVNSLDIVVFVFSLPFQHLQIFSN